MTLRYILETSGHVSALKKSDNQPVTAKDLNIQTMGGGLPTVLINDGKLVEKNLRELGYNEKWLNEKLSSKGIASIKDVYAALIDSMEIRYGLRDWYPEHVKMWKGIDLEIEKGEAAAFSIID